MAEIRKTVIEIEDMYLNEPLPDGASRWKAETFNIGLKHAGDFPAKIFFMEVYHETTIKYTAGGTEALSLYDRQLVRPSKLRAAVDGEGCSSSPE